MFMATLSHAQVYIERLRDIVSINSGSGNVQGVRQVQEKIRPWFEELGLSVELKANANGADRSGPLLVGFIKGKVNKTITLLMHADTVFEPSSPFQTITMVNEHSMKGPGVIDNKGGIIVLIEGLKKYFETTKTPQYNLRVVVTPNEEVGGAGFVDEYKKYSEDSWLVLSFEPAHGEGDIIQGRKGNLWYDVEVKGKEAHSGRSHHLGVNACHLLASKIHVIQKFTNYKKGITVSVGHLTGGQDKFNIVCGDARAKIDVRFPDQKRRSEIDQKIRAVLKDPRISISVADDTPAFNVNKVSGPLVKKYLEMVQQVEGKKVHAEVSGGVGDANFFSREGVGIIDGLGPIGGGLHTTDEYIDLRSIPTRSTILARFLLAL